MPDRARSTTTQISVWPQAIAAGAELRPFSRVERIETGADGRATGVVYVDRQTGLRYQQDADVVILAANGVGTPRLLLLSESARFPNGLANSSDQVGRNLMHHGLAIIEIWTRERTDAHQGIISAVFISEEFAETDPARGFVNGFTMHITRMNGAGYQANGSHSGNVAPWGPAHHAWFREHFGHGFNVLIVGDDLPIADNRVTLSETLRDDSGLPAPKITYKLDPNDRRMMDFGIDRAKDLARAVDAFDVKVNAFTDAEGNYRPPAWHLLGTCRLGDDPATSVVNQWQQSWDVPNLFIMDGSVLPTGGAVNPTSTIGALTLRAATHLRDHFAEVRRGARLAATLIAWPARTRQQASSPTSRISTRDGRAKSERMWRLRGPATQRRFRHDYALAVSTMKASNGAGVATSDGAAPAGMLTLAQAAELVGVTRSTVSGWLSSGHLTAVMYGRRRYVRPEDLANAQTKAHVGSVVPAWRQNPRRAGKRLRSLREAAGMDQIRLGARVRPHSRGGLQARRRAQRTLRGVGAEAGSRAQRRAGGLRQPRERWANGPDRE